MDEEISLQTYLKSLDWEHENDLWFEIDGNAAGQLAMHIRSLMNENERLKTEVRATSSYDRQMQKLADEQAARIEALEQAINDWADAIVDWEGIDFVDRIKNERSRAVIEAALREKD